MKINALWVASTAPFIPALTVSCNHKNEFEKIVYNKFGFSINEDVIRKFLSRNNFRYPEIISQINTEDDKIKELFAQFYDVISNPKYIWTKNIPSTEQEYISLLNLISNKNEFYKNLPTYGALDFLDTQKIDKSDSKLNTYNFLEHLKAIITNKNQNLLAIASTKYVYETLKNIDKIQNYSTIAYQLNDKSYYYKTPYRFEFIQVQNPVGVSREINNINLFNHYKEFALQNEQIYSKNINNKPSYYLSFDILKHFDLDDLYVAVNVEKTTTNKKFISLTINYLPQPKEFAVFRELAEKNKYKKELVKSADVQTLQLNLTKILSKFNIDQSELNTSVIELSAINLFKNNLTLKPRTPGGFDLYTDYRERFNKNKGLMLASQSSYDLGTMGSNEWNNLYKYIETKNIYGNRF
ncbi:hypothetical protein [Mycoplasma simbae]|uniref:hypothetical protein n=1 Tax=Mycoplasma simbae TaxID=36744 RepID=UPI0004958B09|nr:hypothetical protein [Mycoplasma simbae]